MASNENLHPHVYSYNFFLKKKRVDIFFVVSCWLCARCHAYSTRLS